MIRSQTDLVTFSRPTRGVWAASGHGYKCNPVSRPDIFCYESSIQFFVYYVVAKYISSTLYSSELQCFTILYQ